MLSLSKEIVRLHTGDERAWSRLDAAFEKQEDDFDLIDFCLDIIKQHPGNSSALVRLSVAYKRQGKYTELISTCFELLTTRPGDAQTWCNLADADAPAANTMMPSARTRKP